jgi:hypothetical protein
MSSSSSANKKKIRQQNKSREQMSVLKTKMEYENIKEKLDEQKMDMEEK